MSKNKTRKYQEQVRMVKRGFFSMNGSKDKLCLDAEVSVVTSNRPKMLAAYRHKLHPEAERVMIANGFHQMLKEYRFELDEDNQILLVKSNRPKLLAAYGFKLCPAAESILRQQQDPRLNRAYGRFS